MERLIQLSFQPTQKRVVELQNICGENERHYIDIQQQISLYQKQFDTVMNLNTDARTLKEELMDAVHFQLTQCEARVKREHDLFATDFARCHSQAKASVDKLQEWKEVQAANAEAIRQIHTQTDTEIRELQQYIDDFKEKMAKSGLEANEKHLGLVERVECHHQELLADRDKLRDINGEYKESKALIA